MPLSRLVEATLVVKDGPGIAAAGAEGPGSSGERDTAFLSGESATDCRRERLCCKPRLGAGDAGPTPSENEERAIDGPERFNGLSIPSLSDAVDELTDELPNNDNGFVLIGDSYPDAVGVGGSDNRSGFGAGG